MQSLTVLLMREMQGGMKVWQPTLVPDGSLYLSLEKVSLQGRKRRMEINDEELILHLTKPLPPERAVPTHTLSLFSNYAAPPGGFPCWEIAGDSYDTLHGYTRLRNVQVYGIKDIPTCWSYAILGVNVHSGIEAHL